MPEFKGEVLLDDIHHLMAWVMSQDRTIETFHIHHLDDLESLVRQRFDLYDDDYPRDEDFLGDDE